MRLDFWRPKPTVVVPPAPPLELNPVSTALGCCLVGVYFVVLVQFACRRLGRLRPWHSIWVWPICLINMLVGYFSLKSSRATFVFVPTFDGTSADEIVWVMFVWVVPITAFLLLLVSELACVLLNSFGPGAQYAYLRQPVMAAHAVSLGYYIFMPLNPVCKSEDIFGRPFHPMRNVLWTASVSCMIMAVFYVADGTLAAAGASSEMISAIDRDVACAFIGGLLTFVCGGLASSAVFSRLLWGSMIPNLVMLLVSIAGFYGLLISVCNMLKRAQNVVKPLMARQFAVIQKTIVVVWHLFPLVWLLAAFHLISVNHEYIGYLICDVSASRP